MSRNIKSKSDSSQSILILVIVIDLFSPQLDNISSIMKMGLPSEEILFLSSVFFIYLNEWLKITPGKKFTFLRTKKT